MSNPVAISICIPTYRNLEFLERLLVSIAQQSFRDFEVIITDDTPDNSVQQVAERFSNQLPIRYFRNNPSLGTPENWNESIRKAQGHWIKLMHNDDWFASPDALQHFYQATKDNPDCKFFFAAFQNIEEETGRVEVVKCTSLDLFFLRLSPLHLFKRVYVGNPSCTLVHRDVAELYDRRFKFVVDFEYYIRCIRKLKKYNYLDAVLLNIGFHADQVTKHTFEVPSVQVPENLLLIELMGLRILRNPFVFDYYWRLFRNMSITRVGQVEEFWKGEIPGVIKGIVRFQSSVPKKILKVGVFSKMLMSLRYILFLVSGR